MKIQLYDDIDKGVSPPCLANQSTNNKSGILDSNVSSSSIRGNVICSQDLGITMGNYSRRNPYVQNRNYTRLLSIRAFALLALSFIIFFGVGIGALYIYKSYYSNRSLVLLEQDDVPVINDRPIIGILAQEYLQDKDGNHKGKSYIAASYIKFVEGGGGRVVPIMIDEDEAYYRQIFSGINGLLFPGGGVYFNVSGYARAGAILLDLAREANDKGDYFPVWGTCLGFEYLIYNIVGEKNILEKCGAYNESNNVVFTEDVVTSRLFRRAPVPVINYLSQLPVTSNFHNNCLTADGISKNQLHDVLRIMSWNYDASSGLDYVSSMEHRIYPFYGVQFHPEKNMYEWSSSKLIPHSKEAILVGQYFAQFFVNEARKNGHSFPGDEEYRYLIYNYQIEYTGGVEGNGTFMQRYFFDL